MAQDLGRDAATLCSRIRGNFHLHIAGRSRTIRLPGSELCAWKRGHARREGAHRLNDWRLRAVVEREAEYPPAWKVVDKPRHVDRRRTTESVDRLARVADYP